MPNKLTIQEINSRKPAYSRLTAIDYGETVTYPTGRREVKIRCKCSCGKIHSAYSHQIINGKSASCGCYNIDILKARKGIKYPSGGVHPPHRLYSVWRNMKARCFNPNHVAYKHYGGRGVKICEEWLRSSKAFIEWGKNNGWKLGLELDKDIKGNGLLYSPETCIFVTTKENACNRRNNIKIKYKGRVMTISEVANIEKFPLGTLCDRINRGMSLEMALKYNSKIKIRDGITEEQVKSVYNDMKNGLSRRKAAKKINVSPVSLGRYIELFCK